jgi:Putative peptidoglycan binding domain
MSKRLALGVGVILAAAGLAIPIGGGVASAACSVGGYHTEQPAGQNSDDVRCIQQTLHDKGFDSGPVDGWFGPITAGAVVAFQTANGITVDGEVGQETAGVLGVDYAQGTTSAQPAARAAAPSGGGGNGWTSGNCASFAEEAAAVGLPWGTFSRIAQRESGCNPNVWVVDHDDDGGGLFGFNFKGSMINFWPNLCGMSKGEVRGNVGLQMACAKAAYDRSGLAPWSTSG